MNKRYYLAVVILVLITLCIMGLFTVGWPVVCIVGGAAWIAVFAWYKTTYKIPAEPSRILPLYLLTLAGLQFHMAEEYLSHFAAAMSHLFSIHFTQDMFVTTFTTVGPGIWILAALGIYYKHPLGYFMAWFVFIGPGCLEFSHYIFPLIQGGPYHYFPGMGTAWLPVVPGIYGMYRVMTDYRKSAQLARL